MENEASCCHDGDYGNEANVAIEHLNSRGRTEGKYPNRLWYTLGMVFLIKLFMGVFINAHAFRLPAKWLKYHLHGHYTTSNADITKATKNLQSLWNYDIPFVSQAPAPGISIAVSKDLNSNIQLYDLDSSGVLASEGEKIAVIRRIQNGNPHKSFLRIPTRIVVLISQLLHSNSYQVSL